MDDYGIEKPAPRTNQGAKPTRCQTCGGDRYVTVRLRSPDQTLWMTDHNVRASTVSFHEEVAPCYVCNVAAYEHVRGLDPARARQMHAA